jgi:branched-chain amino acid transport system substrate-binding protein
MLSVIEVLKQAKSTETTDLLAAMEGLTVDAPSGTFTYRAADHQATMGAYVGKTGFIDGKPAMIEWSYADGADYLPSEEEAKKLRP